MNWLVDADVLCQPVKTHGHPGVIAWLRREQENCYTSTVVIAQVAYWVRTKEGPAQVRLQQWLTRALRTMQGRILTFNVATAHVWADQKHLLSQSGMPMPAEDSYIAATARRHGLTIVTGNDRDFRRPGLPVFNPFKELPPL